uniref:CRAL-TRIO domain-containing protein n=1 Tax=Amphora coffeiformis TaxID=265554 RepID=A0A7S3L748_9STRA
MTGLALTSHQISQQQQQQLENDLLSQLTEQELKWAARASYDYLDDPAPKDEKYAREFVQKFLRSTSDPEKALKRVQGALAFRQQIDVDGIRLAFDQSNKHTAPLKAQLENKSLYVQGYDKEGRSTYVFQTSKVREHDEEWTLKSHIYTLERALASSKAHDGTVNAMIDFKDFSLINNAPPLHIGKQFMTTFRDHYAGSVNQIFLLDAPSTFLVLWKVMKSFVGTKTRNKINFVNSSSTETEEHLTQLYDKEQLAPWMMQGGTNDRPFDLEEYLHKTSFNKSFGEKC